MAALSRASVGLRRIRYLTASVLRPVQALPVSAGALRSRSSVPGDNGEKLNELRQEIENTVKRNKVVVFSKSWCPFCRKVDLLLQSQKVQDLKVVEADHRGDEADFMLALQSVTSKRTVPQVFIGEEFVGGCDDTFDLHESGRLTQRLAEVQALDTEADLPGAAYDYDLLVVGGGSGGCAAALEASKVSGLRIAVADFVKPSPQGTTWGVGGTCTNVGCIPKKLMHIGATMGENVRDLESFGWTSDGKPVTVAHDWDKMCTGIRQYIKEVLNEGMLNGFEANGITYFNSYATLRDRHTVELHDGTTTQTKTARYILLSAGGRPSDGDYPGSELCINSDDLFWLKDPPGKTLVVGAAYIALECAGFLSGLGFDTTVMVRSILLRGFDRECVDRIDEHMQKHGTKFIRGCVPSRFEKGTQRKVRAYWKGADGTETFEEYDTVMLAIGRKGEAEKLGLANAGVWFRPRDGKVEAPCEQTNVPNIFCIGDLVANRPELTPVAKNAGKKVVRRIFKDELEALDYRNIATTVFTPLEYGMVGLSEEDAKLKYGPDGYVKYTKEAKPLEWAIVPHRSPEAFFKVIVDRNTNRVVGFHVLGPNAGEITQAMALAVKLGATKDQLDDTIGIHPTLAETMTMLSGEKIKGVACET